MKNPVQPALAIAFFLVLSGCSQDTSVGPSEQAATQTNPKIDPAFQAQRARSAVNLGPAASAFSTIGSSSVSALGATATSIPFDPEQGPFANPGPSCDLCVVQGAPIGFSFAFFGNTYTTFNISTQGFINFGQMQTVGCCQGGLIPSSNIPNNIIAAAWTDLDPEGGGTISYETRGRAPTRYLVVSYAHMPWHPEVGTNRVTTQIILYEGSNVIEIHTANQSAGHIYTQGVEDATGAEASFLPGRVAANFGLTNGAVRFTTSASSWVARAGMPTARRGMAVWGANGLLYAFGGSNSAGTVLTTVQAYSPSTNGWSTKASLPAPRQTGNAAVAINGIMYLAGGHDAAGLTTKTLFAYNTSTNVWSSKTAMPAFSSCGGSAVIGGKLYAFSGCTRNSAGAQIASGLLHRYDPATNTWTTLRAAPVAHFQPVVGAIGGKLYVVGGSNGTGTTLNRVDMYDPASNSWTSRAAMPTARQGAAATSINGKLFVFGGRNGTTYLSTVEAYDPLSNTWSSRASMPTARALLGVGGVSGFLYAVGGRNSSSTLATNERFTP